MEPKRPELSKSSAFKNGKEDLFGDDSLQECAAIPVFRELNSRLGNDREWYSNMKRVKSEAHTVASLTPLVHVWGGIPDPGNKKRISVLDWLRTFGPEEPKIPTSESDVFYSDETRHCEENVGYRPSAYFYAGRACPEFGQIAMAFRPQCENTHTGDATPFDTGGVLGEKKPNRIIRFAPELGDSARIEYVKRSTIPLTLWREVFAMFLSVYFRDISDYWGSVPWKSDPEGIIPSNTDWRAWTFEVRFHQGQSLQEYESWCGSEVLVNYLYDFIESEPLPGSVKTFLNTLLIEKPAIIRQGSPKYCQVLEESICRSLPLSQPAFKGYDDVLLS